MVDLTAGLIGLGAGLSVGAAALATAWAQSTIGSAGMGLMAEKDGTFTNVLILMAIPETMVILGFLVAFFLIGKIPGIG